ncbi:MAG: PAS domain-containing sensor histidine kinase [Dehalococcoidia bacterium]|nr:PAS domain-containing sensor histidine kinase [Dehalococcoidia bacterium]
MTTRPAAPPSAPQREGWSPNTPARESEATDRLHSLDALLGASPDATALVAGDGRYLHVNDALARLAGVSRRSLIGRAVQDFHPDIGQSIARYLEDARAGEPGTPMPREFDLTVTAANGDDLEMLVCLYPVTGVEARLLGLGLSLTDVTAQRRSERALREANALKDEFLCIASHELRNPVATVRGAAQLLARSLKRGLLDEERLQTHLEAILAASEHLAALTDDLLDVSRLQRGLFPVRPRRASLRSLTDRVVAGHPAGLRCRVRAMQGAPLAYVDPERFEQILENLLDNAHKYAPGNSPIELDLGPLDDGVLLRVRDYGMGLPPGGAESIFRPFGRASNAIANNVPGLGLGLYICRRIAEQTGGRLWAASDGEGVGSTFFAWFPCDPPAQSGSEP